MNPALQTIPSSLPSVVSIPVIRLATCAGSETSQITLRAPGRLACSLSAMTTLRAVLRQAFRDPGADAVGAAGD